MNGAKLVIFIEDVSSSGLEAIELLRSGSDA